MPLSIVRNDITRMHVDAIVNAANEWLRHGGGVCGAIFAAAGPEELQAACNKIGHCPTGSSVATPAFRLPAKHVIHTVGPIWHGGNAGEEEALRSCYRSALALALELDDASIAFPLISSGIYGYPKDQAIDVALTEIRSFLDEHDMDVYLTIFDAESLRAGRGRFSDVAEYIDDHYVSESPYLGRRAWERAREPMDYESAANQPVWEEAHPDASAPAKGGAIGAQSAPSAPTAPAPPAASARPSSAAPHAGRPQRRGFLERLLGNLDESFSTTLLRMIDERGLKDSEVYKRANLSRQHFSKIRGNEHYQPKKHTVLALAVALELSVDETRLLLERAGYALTHANKRDVIVEYYLLHRIYDIYEINLALYAFDQPLLG